MTVMVGSPFKGDEQRNVSMPGKLVDIKVTKRLKEHRQIGMYQNAHYSVKQ